MARSQIAYNGRGMHEAPCTPNFHCVALLLCGFPSWMWLDGYGSGLYLLWSLYRTAAGLVKGGRVHPSHWDNSWGCAALLQTALLEPPSFLPVNPQARRPSGSCLTCRCALLFYRHAEVKCGRRPARSCFHYGRPLSEYLHLRYKSRLTHHSV